MQTLDQTAIRQKLQSEIRALQGFHVPSLKGRIDLGLGMIESTFPDHAFSAGGVHEFVSNKSEHAASTAGFMCGLLSRTMQRGGPCLWIGHRHTIFPTALSTFGVEPHRIIFIDMPREQDVLWAMEEALKYEGLSAVVGEIKDLGFNQSRRLQLAVEKSQVLGFVHRKSPRKVSIPLATLTRWEITPVESRSDEGLPGVGFAHWNVNLLKIRNGEPGQWQVAWVAGGFRHVEKHPEGAITAGRLLKTG
jgi:protein ImuA